MPRGSRSSRRWLPRFSWREWLTIVVGVGVITAMVLVADSARRDSVRHLQAQVLVERIRADGQELAAINWEALGRFASDPGHAGAGVLPLVDDAFAVWNPLTASLRALHRLEPGPTEARLRREADAIDTSGAAAFKAFQAGATRRVAEVEMSVFGPAIATFDLDARRLAETQQQIANSAADRAGIAYVASLVVGLLALLLLGFQLHRLRRAAVVATRQRTLEREGERRIRALVEHASDVIAVIDPRLEVGWVSPSVRQMLGYEPDEVLGRRLTEVVHRADRPDVERLLGTSTTRPGTLTLSTRIRHLDGSWRHVEAIADNRLDDPVVHGIVLSLRDVTARKELEDELRHQAFHDSLTGLANRALFEDRLGHALARARRSGNGLGVLFLDLDDFKTVNDSLGHEIGDELLRAVAIQIAGVVRTADTAARLGGDEFAVLIEVMEEPDTAETIAGRILGALAAPFTIQERTLRTSASIGLAVTDGSADVHELLRNADSAMYAAKESGKNVTQRYDEGMHRRALDRLELTAELQDALERGQFELDYQPIVELATGRIVAAEALVRWGHPRRGRLAPDQFIPLAEETGLIVPLGAWVLRTACAQAHAWCKAFPERSGLDINVNVSTRQLHDPSFAATVIDTLAATGLAPERLVLEITESVLPADGDIAIEQLTELKRAGILIAVDDFGTGYSALSRLRHYPIDIVKIDRSFIAGIEHDREKAELVRGILNLGESLRLQIVAEGIEADEQAKQLRAMRSQFGQGFLFSRPVSGERMSELLRADQPRESPSQR